MLLAHSVSLTYRESIENIYKYGGEILTEHGVTDVTHGIELEVEKRVVMWKVRAVQRSHLLQGQYTHSPPCSPHLIFLYVITSGSEKQPKHLNNYPTQ